MGRIASIEEACFAKWRERRPHLVPDGAVDDSTYEKSDPKLLFVLKEVNNICDPVTDRPNQATHDRHNQATWKWRFWGFGRGL